MVAGWFKPEYEAFGIELPSEHEVRYAYAQEWLDIIQKLWSSEERFDWDGTYFHLKNVHSDPKPYRGTVPILKCGGLQEGRGFAVKNANYLSRRDRPDPFRSMNQADQGPRLRREAKGRCSHLFALRCRPTEQEAQDYYKYFVGESDWLLSITRSGCSLPRPNPSRTTFWP